MSKNEASQKALKYIKKSGGIIRTAEAISHGIHAVTLYRLVQRGDLIKISRGVFRLRELPSESDPDLIVVSKRIPKGVVCLISALAYHELTTQIPRHIFIALPRRSSLPNMKYPPIRMFWYSQEGFSEGLQIHKLDGADVRIFSPERSVVDAFKYRNKIGFDIALEALRNWRKKKGDLRELLRLAKLSRVEKVMKPYLESLL